MTADAYDFYPCLVDDAPASIYVNLRYGEDAPPADADTHYAVVIQMREPGSHGIGSEAEATLLEPIEGALLARARALGLVHVGRLRHRGAWELAWYGPGDRGEALRRTATELVTERRVAVHSDHDPAWRYYRELLLPDAERLRWMDDRRLVQILAEQGDRVVQPRPVEHRAAFATAAARAAFVAALDAHGFAVDEVSDAPAAALPYVARVARVDAVELEHIHDVVMLVVDAAVAHGGRYDGWVAPIESA